MQETIVRALEDPGFYPHRPASVEHVQTDAGRGDRGERTVLAEHLME